MTQFLPPNLLALFAPREPVPYLPPTDKLTHEKKRQPYSGISEFLDYFEDPEETPLPVHVETKAERIERKIREKAEQVAYKLEQDLALWDPQHNDSATSDPYKTLFVGRINYYTSETKLKREFEAYGKIKQIKIVHDSNTGKSRGYAFIEFEDENGMHAAYKRADGKKIDDRRVVVDIERGRTIEGWKPRRLGGGKGGIRRTALNNNGNNNNNNETIRDDFDTAPAIVSTSKLSKSDRGDRRSKERERERKRSRDKRSRSRSRDRKRRSRSKDRQRSKSRERSKKSRRSKSKEKDRSHKKRSKSRDRSSKHVPQVVEDHQMIADNYNEDNNNNNNGY